MERTREPRQRERAQDRTKQRQSDRGRLQARPEQSRASCDCCAERNESDRNPRAILEDEPT